jgi:hypothetical protein
MNQDQHASAETAVSVKKSRFLSQAKAFRCGDDVRTPHSPLLDWLVGLLSGLQFLHKLISFG